MTLKDLQVLGRDRINRQRCVQRLLRKESFASAWDKADNAVRKEVAGWCFLGKVNLVESWLKKSESLELNTMSVRQLRERASKKGVVYYGKLSRAELIWEITNAEEQDPNSQDRDPVLQERNGVPRLELGQSFKEGI